MSKFTRDQRILIERIFTASSRLKNTCRIKPFRGGGGVILTPKNGQTIWNADRKRMADAHLYMMVDSNYRGLWVH